MELNGYRLLLPEGTLDYFDLVDVKERVNEVVFHLEEKNMVPEKYTETSFPTAFPLKKRRLLLFFEKPVTAVRVSRRSFSSGSPIFNDKISRTNISNGIAAENGLPESPINKTPSFSAASVGIQIGRAHV